MKKTICFLLCLVFITSSAFAYTDTFIDNENFGELVAEDNKTVSYIVELEGGGLLSRKQSSFYGGSVENFEENTLCAMEEEAQNPIKEAEAITGEEVTVRYTHLLNGFSIEGDISLKEKLEKIDGVKHVGISQIFYCEAINVSELTDSPNYIKQDLRIGLTDDVREKYTGDGIVIGVIDSELRTEHEAFNTAPKTIALTKERISQILEEESLIAETKFEGLSADDVYKNNGKIPFVFDYVAKDTETSITEEYLHGTHVSAIAAGNSENFKGVAPDSQLVFMKVSADGSNYASEANIVCALEDLVKLKVDVINLSMGTTTGFTGMRDFDSVFELIKKEGIAVSISAGNSGRFGEKRATFNPMADNPDYGLISTPAAYEYPTAVASVNVSMEEEESEMSAFSSWGATYDLRLKPEITAAGGNIVSAGYNGKYMYKHGTSMAAPQYAGATGVMLHYLKDFNSSLPKQTAQNIAQKLLASTADIEYDDSKPVSPRKQGAGVINLTKATSDLTVIYNGEKTKIELGEITNDGEGVKTAKPFKFTIQNFSTQPVKYNLSAIVMTDAYEKSPLDVNVVKDARLLEKSNVVFKVDGLEVDEVLVEASSWEEITAEFLLDENEIDELKEVFVNGFYIEGFIMAEDSESEKSVSIPYMGFYGNWDEIPAFYGDVTKTTNGYNGFTGLYAKDSSGKISFLNYSPNTDTLYYSPRSGKDIIFFSDNLRNIKRLDVTIKDDKDTVFRANDVPKNYNMITIISESQVRFNFGLNNTILLADKSTMLGDGLYNVNYTGVLASDGVSEQNGSLKLCVDSIPPYIRDAYYKVETNTLHVLGVDNTVNPAVFIHDENNDPISTEPVKENGYYVFNMNGSAVDKCQIVVADVAGNARSYKILRAKGYAAAYMGNALSRVNKFSALVSGGIILNKPAFTPKEGEKVRFFAWNNNLMPLTSGN